MPEIENAPDVLGNLKKKRSKGAQGEAQAVVETLTPEQRFKARPFERLMMAMAWPNKVTRMAEERWGAYQQARQQAGRANAEPMPADQAERFIALGRETCFDLGATGDVLERLSEDAELAQAVCRIALGGCVDMAYYGSGETAPIRSLMTAEMGGGLDRSVGSLSRALLVALSADTPDERGESALKSALIELAGDEKAWAQSSDRGELEAMALLDKRSSTTRGQKGRSLAAKAYKRLAAVQSSPPGLYARSRDLTGEAHSLGGGAGHLTERNELLLYLKEQEGFEIAIPRMMAKAFEIGARTPLLWAPYDALCAERISQGFAGLSAQASFEELLPGSDALEPAAPASKAKKAVSPSVKKALLEEGVAGEIALAATEAYQLTAKDAQGLVGEAKKALLERSGLTAGAWKMAIANPLAAAALIEGLQFQKKARSLFATKTAKIKNKAKTAQELERAIQEGERRVVERFSEVNKAALAGWKMEAVSTALVAGAASGVSAASVERLLACADRLSLGHWRASRFMMDVLAGRSPCKRWPTLSAGDTRLRLADVEALKKQAPVWIKCFCEQIDARFKKALDQKGVTVETAGAPGLPSLVKLPAYIDQSRISPPEGASASQLALNEALADFADEMGLATDFLAHSQEGYFAGLPEKFGWSMVMRHQAEWHAAIQRQAREQSPDIGRVWEPALGKASEGDFSAVELVSGGALFDEGDAMKHCVSSYAARCESGGSRIFSVRKHGARMCTLELGPLDERGRAIKWDGKAESRARIARWEVVQNKGRHNAAVSDDQTLAFCERLAQRAHEEDLRVGAELDAKAPAKESSKRAIP